MTRFQQDLQRIQDLVSKAFAATGALISMPTTGGELTEKEQGLLMKTAAQFEQATVSIRTLCETNLTFLTAPEGQPQGNRWVPHVSAMYVIENQWIHICLEGLLPHCKYQTPYYLADTLRRLFDDHGFQGQKLPYYESAILVIDEHSEIAGRHVFDQDNKGWKAIPNALKGRVIADDDQYHLGLLLLSRPSPENRTYITIIPPEDIGDFCTLRNSPSTSDILYRGH